MFAVFYDEQCSTSRVLDQVCELYDVEYTVDKFKNYEYKLEECKFFATEYVHFINRETLYQASRQPGLWVILHRRKVRASNDPEVIRIVEEECRKEISMDMFPVELMPALVRFHGRYQPEEIHVCEHAFIAHHISQTSLIRPLNETFRLICNQAKIK